LGVVARILLVRLDACDRTLFDVHDRAPYADHGNSPMTVHGQTGSKRTFSAGRGICRNLLWEGELRFAKQKTGFFKKSGLIRFELAGAVVY